MKPKPLVALNHLTVPIVILTSPRCANAPCPYDLRTSFRSDFSDVLGSRAGSARSTSKSIVRMRGVYANLAEIASDKRVPARKAPVNPLKRPIMEENSAFRSTQTTDLFLGHHALDIL